MYNFCLPLFSNLVSLLLAFWLLPLFLLRVLFALALSLHVPCLSLLSAFSLIVCEKNLINTIDPSILEKEWTASKGITRCLHSLSTVYCLCINSACPNCPLFSFPECIAALSTLSALFCCSSYSLSSLSPYL